MSYTVFARKYRPQTFDDVVGQEHITRTLKNAIEQKRLAHAYIFVGPRGTGKTSTARILAKSLNCLNSAGPTIHPCGECDSCREIAAGTSLDVLEFDAASNTQVDKVRELIIDNVRYLPSRGRFKVYIVDEVHMLSTSSFNALLKTLEEPPEHVKFLFATTDVQKVPTTILSRCQRFDLKRIPTGLIASHLLEIARRETIDLTPQAADTVAHGAEGGMRDAESMLDQLVAFCGNKIDEPDVLSVFGLTAHQTVSGLSQRIIEGDTPGALSLIHEQAEAGRDLSRLMSDLISHLRNLLVVQADPASLADEMSESAVAALEEQGAQVTAEKLLELIEQFAAAEQRMKWAANKRMHFEIAAIRAVQTLKQATLTDVLDALAAMRGGGEGGAPPSRPLPPRPAKAREPSAPRASAPKPSPIAKTAVDPEPPVAAPPAAPAEKRTVEPEVLPIEESFDTEPPESFQVEEPPPRALDLRAVWNEVGAKVKVARPLIFKWVEAGVLLSIDGTTALVGFPPASALAADGIQQPNHRALVEKLLSEATGRTLELKCQVRAGLEAPEAMPESAVEAEEPPADPVQQFKDDPLIRKALEIFRAEIQPA